MRDSITLLCSQEQYEGLYEALSKTRGTSHTIKVNKASLQALLIDHAKVLAKLEIMEKML